MNEMIDAAFAEDRTLVLMGLEKIGVNHASWGIPPTKTFDEFLLEWRKREFEWEPEDPSRPLRKYEIAVVIEWHAGELVRQLRQKDPASSSGYKPNDTGLNGTFVAALKFGEDPRQVARQKIIQYFGQQEPRFADTTLFSLKSCDLHKLNAEECPEYPPLQIVRHRRIVQVIISDRIYHELYEYGENVGGVTYGWVGI